MNISHKELIQEINKHLSEPYSDEKAVHRSQSGVVMAESRESSRRAPRGGFNSAIGKPYETVGEITRITPIMQKIKCYFFNEINQDKYIGFEEDKNQKKLQEIEKKTEKHKAKLEMLKVNKDKSKIALKKEINKSQNRLQKFKYGKFLNQKDENISTSIDTQIQNNEKIEIHLNKLWEITKKQERDKSFEEKLRFYVESPRMARRRNLTEHVPWKDPINPNLPSTPENNKFYPKFIRKSTRKSTVYDRSLSKKRESMQIGYLRHPNILGKEGTNILINILNDEKKNFRASDQEIKYFNEIVNRRLSLTQKISWKDGIEQYALRKLFQEPVPEANILITEFFS